MTESQTNEESGKTVSEQQTMEQENSQQMEQPKTSKDTADQPVASQVSEAPGGEGGSSSSTTSSEDKVNASQSEEQEQKKETNQDKQNESSSDVSAKNETELIKTALTMDGKNKGAKESEMANENSSSEKRGEEMKEQKEGDKKDKEDVEEQVHDKFTHSQKSFHLPPVSEGESNNWVNISAWIASMESETPKFVDDDEDYLVSSCEYLREKIREEYGLNMSETEIRRAVSRIPDIRNDTDPDTFFFVVS